MENQLQTSSMKYRQVLEHVPPQGPNNYQLPVQSSTYLPPRRPLLTSYSRSTQMSAFNWPQNVMMVDQRMPEDPSQTMLPRNSQGVFDAGGYRTGSTSQVDLTNSGIDWINPAYEKILKLKKMYQYNAIMLVNQARAMKQLDPTNFIQATDPATVNRLEMSRIWAEKILNFINLSRSDLLYWTKDNAYQMMKKIILFFNPEASNSLRMWHAQQVEASRNRLEPPRMQQRENSLQFNNKSASLLRSFRLQENSVNSFAVSSSSRVDQASPSSIVNYCPLSPMRYTCPDDKQSSSTGQYSLMDFLEATSSAADNSTSRDMNAARDLADNVSNCDSGNSSLVCGTSMNSRLKRQSDKITLNDLTSEAELCPSGGIKRLKKEPEDHLLQEIKEINWKLIEIVANVMNVNGSNEGTLVRCSYVPVGQHVETKTPNTSNQMFSDMFVDLIVAADYPNSSPTVLETVPPGCRDAEEATNLCMKAKAKFSLSLEKFSQPMSLTQMAETWNACARQVFVEFAEKMGGGDFSSKYGKWEIVSNVEGNA